MPQSQDRNVYLFISPHGLGHLYWSALCQGTEWLWGPSNSLLSVWLPEEPLTGPHPCFVHGKRNGGINLSVLGAPCCFSLRAQGFSSKRTLGIASIPQNSRALHVDRLIQDTQPFREKWKAIFSWNKNETQEEETVSTGSIKSERKELSKQIKAFSLESKARQRYHKGF